MEVRLADPLSSENKRCKRFLIGLPKKKMNTFAMGEMVLVAKGEAMSLIIAVPDFQSYIFGPCEVVWAKRPAYELLSPSGGRSRLVIHARRLVPFYDHLPHLRLN